LYSDEEGKELRKIASFKISFFLLSIFILGCIPSKVRRPVLNLPSAGFKVEYHRSDLTRPVRKQLKKYEGPIIDTHIHLDPQRSGINRKYLRGIVETIENVGVVSTIVMPVPNEGHMAGKVGSNGPKQRKMLKQIGGDTIRLFCGSEYISNWLHDAYHFGYYENDMTDVLEKLSIDLGDPECSGIGEIGLYHFDKNGHQNVIEYPPTFQPFHKVVGLIAEKEAWLDLHAEPVDPLGKSYENQVFGGLELLFKNYPNLKLILSHTAMTNSLNARRILIKYPNVMMNFKLIKKHHHWRNLEPITNTERLLYDDWAKLFEEMPERFMVGTDAKFGRERRGYRVEKYKKEIKRMRRILGSISPVAAEIIAYKNAKRIFMIDF